MFKTYFENISGIIVQYMRGAQKSVRIVVAWINFEHYYGIFSELLKRNVSVKIIVNNDAINGRYKNIIENLCANGAVIQMKNIGGGIMHHKFCVIDKKICLFGSYNWTINAEFKNAENINVTDDISAVCSYLNEFRTLYALSDEDIKLLRKPAICKSCGNPVVYILLMEKEEEYYTRIRIIQQCGCGSSEIFNDLLDASVYNNYIGIIDSYNDDMYMYDDCSKEEAERMTDIMDYNISNYLSHFRNYRINCPVIHAVGIPAYITTDKDGGGYWCYKIIWRERWTQRYINDEYDY